MYTQVERYTSQPLIWGRVVWLGRKHSCSCLESFIMTNNMKGPFVDVVEKEPLFILSQTLQMSPRLLYLCPIADVC